jgi:hypothetical protein
MTDISLYKNVSLPHVSYKKAKLLSKGKLVKDGDISISKVCDILLSREAKAQGITEKEVDELKIPTRKRKKKLNGKGKK